MKETTSPKGLRTIETSQTTSSTRRRSHHMITRLAMTTLGVTAKGKGKPVQTTDSTTDLAQVLDNQLHLFRSNVNTTRDRDTPVVTPSTSVTSNIADSDSAVSIISTSTIRAKGPTPKRKRSLDTADKANPTSNPKQPKKVVPKAAEATFRLLRNLSEKRARFGLNTDYLLKYIAENKTPKGLTINIKPLVGKEDERFVKIWQETITNCQSTLMNLLIEKQNSISQKLETEIKTQRDILVQLLPETPVREPVLELIDTLTTKFISRYTLDKDKKFNKKDIPYQPRQRRGQQGPGKTNTNQPKFADRRNSFRPQKGQQRSNQQRSNQRNNQPRDLTSHSSTDLTDIIRLYKALKSLKKR